MDRTALIVSYSVLVSDPRIRRQIDWLVGAGWTVDTLGLGETPDPRVHTHYPVGDLSPLLRPAPVKAALSLLLPPAAQFRLLVESRIPRALRSRARAGAYQLIVINELEFAGWVRDETIFGPGRPTAAHLDLHEYHPEKPRVSSLGGRLTARRARWTRALIGHPGFATRTTVARAIADLYAEELSIPTPAIVRNSPPREDLTPRPVDPQRIRLLFHGMASRVRGLGEIVAAMRLLPERFDMTFVLTPNGTVIDELAAEIDGMPRVRIIDAFPMRDIARRVNDYDLEIIFYPPRSLNYRFSLPNKFFEAVQGRVGVVIGESPMMAELVREYGNGVIVDGWEPADLARTLEALDSDRIDEIKQAAHRAATALNAEREGDVFLAAIEDVGR
jgi:glycosyltransferase involved in cell wall biosynthesis